ncbi:hypothetical protein DFH29DRAFT_809715 [Suillus ampliporus]|nr:hypothetical protein DFH29DRAFT_809715 [Suillus ampliporus]
MASIPGPAPHNSAPPAAHPDINSFKTEYHPNSGCPTLVKTFSAFGHGPVQPKFDDHEPWHPFTSRADFEFAFLTHKAALNKEQTDELLWLIQNIVDGHVRLTFRSHNDVSKAWDNAATQLTPHTISVDYKQDKLEFEVYTQSLWDWALDLLQEPLLAPHFVWDAQQLFKHDGTQYEHFIHKLWTADRWWCIQSKLLNNGVPFTIILYADKTHLSSSGIVKGYPVIAHCGNLPVKIRNTTGRGGGRVVGWLPIVPKDADQSGKLSYTNIKCVVWHKAFLKLLELVIIFSKTGFTHKSNFNNIMRWLFPLILLLSADYEEQCVMALMRGTGFNCPCPICLVPMAKLSDHAATYPIWTVEDAQNCLKLYHEDCVAGEEALKEKINLTNPHETISQDLLHIFHSGMFGKHFWTEVKKLLENLGCSALKKVDDQFAAFPQWQKLNHFNSVTNISYSNGNKPQDISKQLLYAAQNVLTQEEDEAGYALLKCIASYLHIDMYISLDVHTESTITAGEAKAKVLVFQKCMADYIIAACCTELGTKSWNFPKMHSPKHIFQDIWEKGATRNFSTRPNRGCHRPLK